MGKSQQLLDAEAELEAIYSGQLEIDYLDETAVTVATEPRPRWFNPDDPLGELDAEDDFDDDDFDDFDDDDDDDDDDDEYYDDDDDDDFYDDDDDDFDDDDEDW